MQPILVGLLECCVMSNADRINEMPTKESDIGPIEAKTIDNDEDEEDGSEVDQTDNYTTLRKSSAFTL